MCGVNDLLAVIAVPDCRGSRTLRHLDLRGSVEADTVGAMSEAAEQLIDTEDWRELTRQARQMQTAYGIIQSIHGDLSIYAITEGITRSLVIGEVPAAGIHIDAAADGLRLIGQATPGSSQHRRSIEQFSVFARGTEVGTLVVHYDAERNETELTDLLDYVLPTICMGVDNAIPFAEVSEYRRTLEEKVVERTAQLAEANQELERTFKALGEAKAARDRFFGNVSHEIRTPLSLILLAAGDIQARAGALLDARRARASTRCRTPRASWSAWSTSCCCSRRARRTSFSCGPSSTDSRRRCSTSSSPRGDPPPKPPVSSSRGALPTRSLIANVDPTAIERVATNLVSNAVKYTPRGGRIEIELDRTRRWRGIRVLDTGVGIDDGARDALVRSLRARSGEDRQHARHRHRPGAGQAAGRGHGGDDHRWAAPDRRHRVARHAAGVDEVRDRESRVAAAAAATRRASRTTACRRPHRDRAAARVLCRRERRGTILLAEDDARLAAMIANLLADDYTRDRRARRRGGARRSARAPAAAARSPTSICRA